MSLRTVVWRRFDAPGHEIARLQNSRLQGTAIFVARGGPAVLSYDVRWDSASRTVRASVEGRVANRRVGLRIDVDRQRRWRLSGRLCPDVEGCDDVDLNFSPSTNALSIRRLSLKVGEEARVRSAWLRFPDFALRPLEQVYRRISRNRYRYRSATGFAATLDVDRFGVVVRYGSIWRAEDFVGFSHV